VKPNTVEEARLRKRRRRGGAPLSKGRKPRGLRRGVQQRPCGQKEKGFGAACARATGGARRWQRLVPTEASGDRGDRGGRTVVGVWCGMRPWAGPRRKGSDPGEKEKKWPPLG
jgi:hypothetical protein